MVFLPRERETEKLADTVRKKKEKEIRPFETHPADVARPVRDIDTLRSYIVGFCEPSALCKALGCPHS